MNIFLVIISIYGGIVTIPMSNNKACQTAMAQFNDRVAKYARAECVDQYEIAK
jgi:hypothetical protein